MGAAAEAVATLVAYDNGVINSPWYDNSWSSKRTWANTSPLYNTKKTVKVVYSAWGALTLMDSGAPVPANAYDTLDFYVNGGTANKPALNAQLFLADSGAWSSSAAIASYCDGGFVPTNAWTHCAVPFSALGGAGHSIGGLVISEAAGKAVTVYFSTIGFGASVPPTVGISVSPTSPSVNTGAAQQFTAAVTGTTNTAVTWSVAEASGCGSVSGAGLYTAPATAGTCHVVATSAADTTKSATATVTVSVPAVAVSVSPAAASVYTSGTQQFAATVANAANTSVTWSVAEASGCGTVSSSGLYTSAATAGTCHVVATSVEDATKSATATVTVSTPPCVPSCAANACGVGDGCGGTCACASGSVCLADNTCCQPSCVGQPSGSSDGCGGVCAAGWNPKWQQRANSGSWWAVYSVLGGSIVKSVTLEVVGGASYPLEYGWLQWQGGVGGVSSGTTVILRATEVTGATARTLPFRYLVDTVPQTDPAGVTPSTNPNCTPPTRGMVTISFDDSLESQYLLARPVLAKYGIKATIYQITGQITPNGGGGYLNIPEAQALAADGHEVGSHTVTHPYLSSLSVTDLDYQLGQSQSWLQTNIAGPVTSLASPMGAYNNTVLTEAKKYYRSHRTVNPGSNYLGQDLYQLNADGLSNTTTVAEACSWIQDAATYSGWRILYWHEFVSTPTGPGALAYPIASFDAILACAKNNPNIDVVTTAEGVDRYTCAAP